MNLDFLGRDTEEFGSPTIGESLTVQSDAVDADINTIVKRFGITGQLPTMLPYVGNVDLTDAPDTFQGAMNVLIKAQDTFMELPADVRSRFSNDPGRFMDFVSERDAKGALVNLDEMRKLGLAIPAKEEQKASPPPAPDVPK